MAASAPIRVLTNIRLPGSDGYVFRTFGDYLPPGSMTDGPNGAGSVPAWRPETERRALADILPLIPAAEMPDVLIISTPEYLPVPVDVAAFPGIRILLITDWNVCLRFLPDLCPLFDFCFTDWPGYRLLSGGGVANVRHQPLFGHDPAVFARRNADRNANRNLDVSFCGNLNVGLHRERNRLLARLAKWGSAAGRPVRLGQAFGDDYVDVLNRSRLVFNYSIRGEANMRLFEAMACGAAPLVEASNQEAAILFQEGRHYFRYEPDRLEDTLEALLADPARIDAVSAAARAAVAGHTKASQIRSLLEAAIRERGTGSGGKSGPAASVKALVKLRVLGAAYTLPEALGEVQARSGALPGLEAETLPGMLLALLEANPAGSLAAARNILERLLEAGGRPECLREFFRMRLAALDLDWEAVLEGARRCRDALSAAADGIAAGTGPLAGIHRHFLAPVELGKGLNTDLNRAFRADCCPEPEAESPTGYPTAQGFASLRGHPALIRAHCLALEARASLALGRPGEALRTAEGIPAADFLSVHPFELMADACLDSGDGARLRAVLSGWYAESPLDTGVWTRVAEGLSRLGDEAGLTAFLGEILVLSRHFLPPSHTEMIQGMLDGQRG